MVEDVVVVTCAFFNHMNTIEFFYPKNKQILKKSVYAGQNFVRKYSYLKIKFHLCISKIISKLLFMQEPTNISMLILLFVVIIIVVLLVFNASMSASQVIRPSLFGHLLSLM